MISGHARRGLGPRTIFAILLVIGTLAHAEPPFIPMPASGASPPPPPLPTRRNTGCLTDVRLDQGDGPLAGVPIRNQSGGTCAAAAVADLIDAWGRSHEPPNGYADKSRLASPLLLAIEYAAQFRDDRIGGRSASALLVFAAAHGTCDQPSLSSLPSSARAGERYEQFENAASPVYDWLWDEWQAAREGRYAIDATVREIRAKLGKELLPPRALPSFAEIAEALKAGSANEFFAAIFARACPESDRVRLDLPKPVTLRLPIRALNSLFNRGTSALPVILSYCSEVLHRGSAFDKNADGCETHFSTIVGRRWNPARLRCEFLVRNSWGPSCDTSSESGLDCEEGKVWLPQYALEKSILGLISLEPAGE